ncbi:hypothetical protein B0H11DRAFT_1904317 [Mycena galericulata]|nr:hypothetical protein B0H11DRAFT_1904317 [Mycena galericulata]
MLETLDNTWELELGCEDLVLEEKEGAGQGAGALSFKEQTFGLRGWRPVHLAHATLAKISYAAAAAVPIPKPLAHAVDALRQCLRLSAVRAREGRIVGVLLLWTEAPPSARGHVSFCAPFDHAGWDGVGAGDERGEDGLLLCFLFPRSTRFRFLLSPSLSPRPSSSVLVALTSLDMLLRPSGGCEALPPSLVSRARAASSSLKFSPVTRLQGRW